MKLARPAGRGGRCRSAALVGQRGLQEGAAELEEGGEVIVERVGAADGPAGQSADVTSEGEAAMSVCGHDIPRCNAEVMESFLLVLPNWFSTEACRGIRAMQFERPSFAILHPHSEAGQCHANRRFSYLQAAGQEVIPPQMIPLALSQEETEGWLSDLVVNKHVDALIVVWDECIRKESFFERALIALSEQELSVLILLDPLSSWEPSPSISKRFQQLTPPTENADEAAFLRALFRLMQRRAGRIGKDLNRTIGKMGGLYSRIGQLYSVQTHSALVFGILATLLATGIGGLVWQRDQNEQLARHLGVERAVVRLFVDHLRTTALRTTPNPNDECVVLRAYLTTLSSVLEKRRSIEALDHPQIQTNVTFLRYGSETTTAASATDAICNYLEPIIWSGGSEPTIARFYFDPKCARGNFEGPGVGNCAYTDGFLVLGRSDVEGRQDCSWIQSRTNDPAEDEQDVVCVYVGSDKHSLSASGESGVLCIATSASTPFTEHDRSLLGQVAEIVTAYMKNTPNLSECE